MKTEASEKFRIEFGERLAKIAKEKNLTQGEVATRAGMDQSTVNKAFEAKFSITLDMIYHLAEAMDHEIVLVAKK